MSRQASGDKLQRMMITPTQGTVQLLVRFAPRTDPPSGSVRDQNGVEQRFNGWLGLLRLLEDQQVRASAPRRPHDRKESS